MVIFPFFPRGTKTSFPGVKHTKRRVDENERGGGDVVIDRASANERRREGSMAGAGRSDLGYKKLVAVVVLV